MSASALIISVCVGDRAPVVLRSEPLRLPQLESLLSVLEEAGSEVSKCTGKA